MHELPLVFFTVFGQTSVGLFALALIAKELGKIDANTLKKANLVAAVLIFVGSAIGGLHMGQPLRALNLIYGLGRSPMSNEIILSGLFMGLAGATVVLTYIGREALARVANVATVLAGLAFAWSIPQVYQLETVAPWNTVHTSLQMWMTVVVAGSALAVAFGSGRIALFTLIVGALVSVAAKPDYVGFVVEQAPALASGQYMLWAFQVLAIVIALVAGIFCVTKQDAPKALMAGAAVLVIAGELVGRVAFYNLWQIPM
ncbi:anaerobic dimethyl sulfoxide reductase chain C [Vibrio ishigakensis]|uniref:Anaerobic dimethyl sulfoxide reductase chain C n=1 Tax=Vibrio ishigakensis TaxID=1481914 RepID=A0A0B8P2D3_9VIBR|nr:anaerobic dimethyl sulfoxide reductase chain C [Vibrio ishigakensis]